MLVCALGVEYGSGWGAYSVSHHSCDRQYAAESPFGCSVLALCVSLVPQPMPRCQSYPHLPAHTTRLTSHRPHASRALQRAYHSHNIPQHNHDRSQRLHLSQHVSGRRSSRLTTNSAWHAALASHHHNVRNGLVQRVKACNTDVRWLLVVGAYTISHFYDRQCDHLSARDELRSSCPASYTVSAAHRSAVTHLRSNAAALVLRSLVLLLDPLTSLIRGYHLPAVCASSRPPRQQLSAHYRAHVRLLRLQRRRDAQRRLRPAPADPRCVDLTAFSLLSLAPPATPSGAWPVS